MKTGFNFYLYLLLPYNDPSTNGSHYFFAVFIRDLWVIVEEEGVVVVGV